MPSGSALEPEAAALDAAFALERAEVNRKRLRAIGPLMVIVHIVHIAVFWVPAALRPTIAPNLAAWRDHLLISHAVTLAITSVLTVLVFRSRYDWIARLMGPVVAALYLMHGATCTDIDMTVADNVTTYVAYCLGMAVILCLTPREAIISYGIGITTLLVGLVLITGSPGVRLWNLPTCGTITVVGVALAWALQSARRRDLTQRLTIERQRDQLTALNAGLERRVHEQVAEIVARASEVEQLNGQLQAQVRTRSSELTLALAKLAQQRGGDGALHRGMLLGGRFAVEDVIGEGGMGAVYSGVDRTSGTRVAIKVVQATSSRTLDALRRFVREAGAAAAVTHPAVVRMLNVDISDDGLLFQVQELIDGEPLTKLSKRPWAAPDAAKLGAILCDALAAAHAVGVVHRDVKPDNVMITPAAPGLKLLDFGIAKLYDAVSSADDAMTRTGVIVGTPAYMAPEQVRGQQEVTDRADVYATGVILFRLLSERHPFEASSPQEMMMKRLLEPAPDVRTFEPSVPETIARLVAGCLEREPGDRPSAAALASQLLACSAGARPLDEVARSWREAEATMTARRRG